MPGRLTPDWTPTNAGAFGATGIKGDEGENFLMEVFASWGWDATLHQGMDSRASQVQGIDITFKKPSWHRSYTCDVKANLNEFGSFFVDCNEDGWIFNPRKISHRIWHVCPTTGWMAWYGREEMQSYIESVGLRGKPYLKINPRDKLPFITRNLFTGKDIL